MSQKSIYSGGSIFTMDNTMPRADAVFVEEGVIKAVGEKSDVNNLVDADTRKIDLNGGFLVPGLIESHNHLSFFAFFLEHCNLGGGACENIDDAVRLLRAHDARADNSEYIVGYCFDDTYTPALRHLNKNDLDKVSTEKAVVVHHMSAHLGLFE
jgi:predicted amidohydrolase YtcJ